MQSRGATVYIIHSVHHPDQRYVGMTTKPLSQRLMEHNEGAAPSTRRCRPWTVIAAIWLPDPAKARAIEHYFKTGSGRAFANRHF